MTFCLTPYSTMILEVDVALALRDWGGRSGAIEGEKKIKRRVQ